MVLSSPPSVGAHRRSSGLGAQTLRTHLDEFERIEQMIASAELRRDAILHEVELHRARWGQELRRATQEAEKTLEMEVIEDKSGKMRNAAR
jgi:hypothetical protein